MTRPETLQSKYSSKFIYSAFIAMPVGVNEWGNYVHHIPRDYWQAAFYYSAVEKFVRDEPLIWSRIKREKPPEKSWEWTRLPVDAIVFPITGTPVLRHELLTRPPSRKWLLQQRIAEVDNERFAGRMFGNETWIDDDKDRMDRWLREQERRKHPSPLSPQHLYESI